MAPTPGIRTQNPLYFLSIWAILFYWISQNICFELTFHSRCFKIRFNATDHRKWIVCILCVLASTAFDVIRPEKNKLILNGSPNQTLEAKQSLQSWLTVHWLRRLDRWTENNHWEVLNYLYCTWYLSIFLQQQNLRPGHFTQFATKITSQQNSVNNHRNAKFHIWFKTVSRKCTLCVWI